MDPDDPEFADFFKSLGLITYHWPFVEICMDNCISVIWQKVPGGNKLATEVPVSLSNKLKFLTKAFNQLPALSEFKSEGKNLVAKIKANKERRHDRIHGGVIGALVNSNQPPIYEFIRIEYQKTSHTTVTGSISATGLGTQAKTVEGLRRDWEDFSHVFISTFSQ